MSLMITGVYRHKKGGLYLALFTATLERNLEPYVVYVGRSGIWLRPLREFLEKDRFKRVTWL